MRFFYSFSSLMLILSFILESFVGLAVAWPYYDFHAQNHHHFLAGRDHPTHTTKYPLPAKAKISPPVATPCSKPPCASAAPNGPAEPCAAANGTNSVFRGSNSTKYTLICNIDFPAQNIYPFILAGSFSACLEQCVNYNIHLSTGPRCSGFVFAPDRIHDADDCYLKSTLDHPSSATIHLVGATIVPSSPSIAISQAAALATNSRSDVSSSASELKVAQVKILGSSTNKPTTQYVSHVPATPMKLATDLLVPGLNTDLVTNYPIAGDTGCWTEDQLSSAVEFSDMKAAPRLSRDGGKGGIINGTHVFIFCDTAIFNPEQGMVGFVSSSVATDDGMKALFDEPLDLVDNIGEWQDDIGRMRGFAPMTIGEESFNIDLSGQGCRYAIWPESSLIPFNASHALLYPTLVYDVVNMNTQAAVFNDIGNSMLLVSVDPVYGPYAKRVVRQLYKQGQVPFGTLGGIRSWGVSGNGGNDGDIYVFGKGDNGVLVGRTTPSGYTDLSTYQYWNGGSWTGDMPTASSKSVMLSTQVQDLDVIYVPAMRSFLMIYLNTLADNTFYYRHLPVNLNPEDQAPDVENILTAQWSDEKILAQILAPAQGYIYAGGMHAGYFGADDITNGGWKILITWTEHTGKDAQSVESGYAHMSASVEVELS